MSKLINKNVASYRKLAGLSQAQMAELLGMKCSTYSQMERIGNISAERLSRIAKIFGVEVEVFYREDMLFSRPLKKSHVIEHFVAEPEPVSNGMVLSMRETNRVKILRNLSKEALARIDTAIELEYKNAKNK